MYLLMSSNKRTSSNEILRNTLQHTFATDKGSKYIYKLKVKLLFMKIIESYQDIKKSLTWEICQKKSWTL